jgi:hypothetical protein
VLGTICCGIAVRKMVAFREDVNAWCQAFIGTDFD